MPTPEEEFEQAFDEVTSSKVAEETSSAEPEEMQEGSAEEIPQSEEDETAEEGAPTEESESEQEESGQDETDYKALYEKETQRTRSWEGRIRAANERAEKAERRLAEKPNSQDKEPPPPEIDPSQDDEEIKVLFEEFPELVKPFQKLVQVKGEEIARKIVQEEIQKFTPALTEIQSHVQQSSTEQHFTRIREAHPDYREVAQSPEFTSWMDSQPSFLKPRYQEIIKEGTADEAIELLDLFKSQNKPTGERSSRQSTSKAAKAAALAAVPSSSGGPPAPGPDPDDFDAAWEEITKR